MDKQPSEDWEKKYKTLSSAFSREKKARKLAEKLLEDKARDLYYSNNELKSSLESLKQTQSQLVQSEKMASVGILAAGVAHEINNPIAYVSSNLEIMADYVQDVLAILNEIKRLPENMATVESLESTIEGLYQQNDMSFLMADLPKVVASAQDGAKKVGKIVADLSEFSALNNTEASEVDVNELLDKTLNLAWNQLKYDIAVVKEYTECSTVLAKSGKLGQVFLNLIINAAHAMENNAEGDERVLTIKTKSSLQKLFVWVSDTGEGIPEEKISSIYDPFFTTKPVGKGTGLGLHISQSIINNHGGNLRVVDSSASGTTFEVVLPLLEPRSSFVD